MRSLPLLVVLAITLALSEAFLLRFHSNFITTRFSSTNDDGVVPEAALGNSLAAKAIEVSAQFRANDEENDFLIFLKSQYDKIAASSPEGLTLHSFYEWKTNNGCFLTEDEVTDMFEVASGGAVTLTFEQFNQLNKIIDDQ